MASSARLLGLGGAWLHALDDRSDVSISEPKTRTCSCSKVAYMFAVREYGNAIAVCSQEQIELLRPHNRLLRPALVRSATYLARAMHHMNSAPTKFSLFWKYILYMFLEFCKTCQKLFFGVATRPPLFFLYLGEMKP